MLLGGEAGHRLEPVGIVGGALFQCPCLHAVGNGVGGFQMQMSAVFQTLLPCVKGFLFHILGHGDLIEHRCAEQIGNAAAFCHIQTSKGVRCKNFFILF